MISSLPEADQLVVRDVTKKFFDLTAVDGVSFSLKKGEVLGLIGPNGSGKSTLINVITGVLPPTSGSVSVDGVPIAGKPQHEIARAGVARTFQHVELFAGLTVLENVVVGALNVHLSRRAATEDALALLDYFGLADLRDAPADSLPYGHERLLEIARALAMRPRYLFLDEPAAGLDESESSMLLRRLAVLPKERNLGMLIVDHDMPLIMGLCDRIHVVNGGKTIAEGSPEEIRNNRAVREAYLGADVETTYA